MLERRLSIVVGPKGAGAAGDGIETHGHQIYI